MYFIIVNCFHGSFLEENKIDLLIKLFNNVNRLMWRETGGREPEKIKAGNGRGVGGDEAGCGRRRSRMRTSCEAEEK